MPHLALSDKCQRQSQQLKGSEWHWGIQSRRSRDEPHQDMAQTSAAHMDRKTLPPVVTAKGGSESIA